MIYSSYHRQSLLESALGLVPTLLVVVAGGWIGFTGVLIPLGFHPIELVLWGLVSLVVGTVIHESAHLVVGLLAGRQVRKIRIGGGSTIFSVRLGGIRVQICANLLDGGAVMLSALDDPSRGGLIAAIAAGPAINIVAGLYAWAASSGGSIALGTFALVNLVLGVTNFIPVRVTARDRDVLTDGMHIWRLLSGKPLTAAFFEGEEMSADARRATIGALEEARDAGADEVQDVHLLAALDHDPEIHRLLAPASITDLVTWPGSSDAADALPLRSELLDRVEKVAFQIARDAGFTRPNAAFVCLALMAMPSRVATRLKEGGVSEAALRQLAQARAETSADSTTAVPIFPDLALERWGSAADRPLELAYRIATADRAEHTGTQHLVAALASDVNSRAGAALWRMGFAIARNDKLIPQTSPTVSPPPLSPQAQGAIAGALLRTGPTYPAGTGELSLGVCDQGLGMGGLLFAHTDVSPDSLVAALRKLPREQSDPVGFTPSMRRMWELRASARLGAGRYADSLSDFRVLEKNATSEENLAISRNNVAYTALMSGDPALRAEALEKAKAAVDFKPDQRAFQGTYAFALMEGGFPARAAEILEKVVVDHPRPRDRALDLCLLAICRARLGDPAAARGHAAAAEAADPRCVLLPRAREEIGSIETVSSS